MICKQCVYIDEDKVIYSGIHCSEDNGDDYIICLCCGGIVDTKEVVFKDLESWMSFDDLDEVVEEKNNELKDLRVAESCIRRYLENHDGIEICNREGCQEIHNFQEFEIYPLSL